MESKLGLITRNWFAKATDCWLVSYTISDIIEKDVERADEIQKGSVQFNEIRTQRL
jgi:hypothetical protein